MARTRNIKPGLFQNEVLATLSPITRYLFAGLWCWSDREGRMEDRPSRIRAQILPYDNYSVQDVDKMLQDLANSPEPFIIRYGANGSKYLAIINFHKHQRPHHAEQASTVPAPTTTSTSTNQGAPMSGTTTEQGEYDDAPTQVPVALVVGNGVLVASSEVLDPLKPPRGRRRKAVGYFKDFDVWWESYPRKEGKEKAQEAWTHAGERIKASKQLTTEDTIAFLLERVKAYAVSPRATKSDKDKVPLASTWLNGGRYDDDPAVWKIVLSDADQDSEPRRVQEPKPGDVYNAETGRYETPRK